MPLLLLLLLLLMMLPASSDDAMFCCQKVLSFFVVRVLFMMLHVVLHGWSVIGLVCVYACLWGFAYASVPGIEYQILRVLPEVADAKAKCDALVPGTRVVRAGRGCLCCVRYSVLLVYVQNALLVLSIVASVERRMTTAETEEYLVV